MRVITLDSNKIVIGVKYVGSDCVLGVNDVASNVGEVGQVQQEDGSFATPTPTEITPQPTLEDKINYLYYKQMGVI